MGVSAMTQAVSFLPAGVTKLIAAQTAARQLNDLSGKMRFCHESYNLAVCVKETFCVNHTK